MKLLSAVLLASALVLLLAGGLPGGEDKVGSTPYYPLEVGNAWHYKVGENKFILRVAKHEKIGKVMCARLELESDKKVRWTEHLAVLPADTLFKGKFKAGERFVARCAVDGKEAKPPIPFFQVPPPKKADAWAVDSKVGDRTVRGKLKPGDKEVEVTVPAGTYKNAYTVRGEDLEVNGVKWVVTYYFARDVGMVKLVLDIGKQQVVFELEKFEPAKK
jgi:hypothetical protein